jgi:hypothetical protein
MIDPSRISLVPWGGDRSSLDGRLEWPAQGIVGFGADRHDDLLEGSIASAEDTMILCRGRDDPLQRTR